VGVWVCECGTNFNIEYWKKELSQLVPLSSAVSAPLTKSLSLSKGVSLTRRSAPTSMVETGDEGGYGRMLFIPDT
jgi:hypothetical protein